LIVDWFATIPLGEDAGKLYLSIRHTHMRTGYGDRGWKNVIAPSSSGFAWGASADPVEGFGYPSLFLSHITYSIANVT